jgi:hypothetical protein
MNMDSILSREVDRIRLAASGERNATLNKVAYTLGGYAHLGLTENDTQAACYYAAVAAGLEAGEISRSFFSGWHEGIKHPCAPPQVRPKENILYDFDSIIPAIDVEWLD